MFSMEDKYETSKWRVPKGIITKRWDPELRPILVAGSAFDASSFGKWLFDWTVHVHGGRSPLADIAADLWLLLTRWSFREARLEPSLLNMKGEEHSIVKDFFFSAQRLWARMESIVDVCSRRMLEIDEDDVHQRYAKQTTKVVATLRGAEFVKTMFGRDGELNRVEAWMQSLRLWNHRFEANCREISTLRNCFRKKGE